MTSKELLEELDMLIESASNPEFVCCEEEVIFPCDNFDESLNNLK